MVELKKGVHFRIRVIQVRQQESIRWPLPMTVHIKPATSLRQSPHLHFAKAFTVRPAHPISNLFIIRQAL
ncbi:hypothetical protein FRX31_002623 [Thalictrum thalictroides]|uniref:Uncharacterized protein n=1 Tax=Thalictrum thalictroides TaxID=46969 RepID=A0A7J6XGY3_THATH|nr:hypothetical protein FRX31_002623 [Thalictrum thalictroides]